MEAMLVISLCSYLYPQPSKTICFSYYLTCFCFNKIEEGGTGSAWKRGLGGREVAQTMYTHVSKCKNNKIRGEKQTKSVADNIFNLIFVSSSLQ
jgi:hypothetical protein